MAVTNTTGTAAPSTYVDPAAKAVAFQKWLDSKNNYVGADKKAQWQQQYDEAHGGGATGALNVRQHNYGDSNNNSGFQLSGSQEEQAGQLSGLEFGKTAYGQNIFQTGEDIQRVKELQRQRTDQSGSDPVSAAIMGQKLSSQANARRQMNASGVSGGAAAGAIEEVGRQKDSDIAASLYGQQRQSISDERSLASNTLSGQTALMQGERAVNVQNPNLPQASSFMDSVICTELYSQGIMSKELYLKDSEYGRILQDTMPHTIVGYHSWAKPTVKLMKKSKLFTKLISIPALKWAKHIAGEESSLVGYVCQNIGEPICNILGRIITLSYGVSYGL